jgi:hypothetical protein
MLINKPSGFGDNKKVFVMTLINRIDLVQQASDNGYVYGEEDVKECLKQTVVNHGCLIWTGRLNLRGNPITKAKHTVGNSVMTVRRLIWEGRNVGEPKPDRGIHFITTCGNKLCVNPAHIVPQINSFRQTLDNKTQIGMAVGKSTRKPSLKGADRKKHRGRAYRDAEMIIEDFIGWTTGLEPIDVATDRLSRKYNWSRTTISRLLRGRSYNKLGLGNVWAQTRKVPVEQPLVVQAVQNPEPQTGAMTQATVQGSKDVWVQMLFDMAVQRPDLMNSIHQLLKAI